MHLTLREIVRSQRITVVVLGADQELAREDVVDGIHVIYLPRRGPWPFHTWSRARFDRVYTAPIIFRVLPFTLAFLRFAFRHPLRSLPTRLRALGIWLLHGTNLPVTTDLLKAREGTEFDELQALICQIQPWLIHADNHDAICAVAGGQGVPIVGFVRDNRFFCARQDQVAAIDHQLCLHCAAGCIEGSGASARFNKALIRQTAVYRRNCLAAMTRVVVASRYLERQLGTFISSNLVRQIVNPVDIVVRPERIFDPHLKTVHIAVIGSLTAKKGQVALMRHLPDLLARIPDLHLHFLGGGPDKAALEKIVRTYRASSTVTLHGNLPRDALYGVMASCQIVAIPSLWAEPFGRVAIEAASMSLPVVAFAAGGLSELVKPGVTGLLVPPGDFAQFVTALSSLATNPELCRQFGLAAGAEVMAAHAPAAVAEKLVAVWQEAASSYRAEHLSDGDSISSQSQG